MLGIVESFEMGVERGDVFWMVNIEGGCPGVSTHSREIEDLTAFLCKPRDCVDDWFIRGSVPPPYRSTVEYFACRIVPQASPGFTIAVCK